MWKLTSRLFLKRVMRNKFDIWVYETLMLNSLESISIWYQMKAYSITFQLNTRYIYTLSLSNFFRRDKPTSPPSWNEKKDILSLKSLDKQICRTKLRSFFILNEKYISHLINQALVILYEVIFVVKILEKWDIFNFGDFHRILHISQFY